MRRGAIVLCGGHSTRMGRDKATLPFGPECMLQRVVRLLRSVMEMESIIIVAANGQELPRLPDEVIVTRDQRENRGPLVGLAAGLRTMTPEIDAAYLTGCDVPLLVPAFVERMFQELGSASIAVPLDGNHFHPLSAVYRRSVLPAVEKLLAEDQLRARAILDEVLTRTIDVSRLRDVDPGLTTLKNLNSPEDYAAALNLAGL